MRVLWVEDDEFVMKTVADYLRKQNVEVEFARTVPTAKRKLAERHYDFMLLDMIIAGEIGEPISQPAGWQLLRDIREGDLAAVLGRPEIGSIPVAVCSVGMYPELFKRLGKPPYEHVEFLKKPFRPTELSRLLRRHAPE